MRDFGLLLSRPSTGILKVLLASLMVTFLLLAIIFTSRTLLDFVRFIIKASAKLKPRPTNLANQIKFLTSHCLGLNLFFVLDLKVVNSTMVLNVLYFICFVLC